MKKQLFTSILLSLFLVSPASAVYFKSEVTNFHPEDNYGGKKTGTTCNHVTVDLQGHMLEPKTNGFTKSTLKNLSRDLNIQLSTSNEDEISFTFKNIKTPSHLDAIVAFYNSIQNDPFHPLTKIDFDFLPHPTANSTLVFNIKDFEKHIETAKENAEELEERAQEAYAEKKQENKEEYDDFVESNGPYGAGIMSGHGGYFAGSSGSDDETKSNSSGYDSDTYY